MRLTLQAQVASSTPELAVGDLVFHTLNFFPKKLPASADPQTMEVMEETSIMEPTSKGLWRVKEVDARHPKAKGPDTKGTYHVEGVPDRHGFRNGIFDRAVRLFRIEFLEGDAVWHVKTSFNEHHVTAVKHAWTRREMKWQEPDAESGGLEERFGTEEIDSRLVYDIVDKNGEVAKGVEGKELIMAARGGKWPAEA